MPESIIEYPKELTTAAWKKAKSLFNTNTGISEILRAAEQAFRAASADITAINNLYNGEDVNGGPDLISRYPDLLVACKRLTASGTIKNYQKALCNVHAHCTKVAAEKSMSSKQKALVLSMAKMADLESVTVNPNSISGHLTVEMRRRTIKYDMILRNLFDGAKLQDAVKRALVFLQKAKSEKIAANKVKTFNAGATTAARDITQMLVNRLMAPQKLKIPYEPSAAEKFAGKGLIKFGNDYRGANESNIDKEIAEMESYVKEASKINSAKPPTAKEMWGGP